MITLNPIYQPITQTSKRYVIVTGGRGSGKSTTVTTLLNLLTYQKNERVLFTRYTLTSAHTSIIPEFLKSIEALECEHDFDITKDTIVNKNTNSDIWFKGIKTSSGNQTGNLKSIVNVSKWVLDEAEELVDEENFDRIDNSIRTKNAFNMVILILNSSTHEHFIWKRFFENSHRMTVIDGYEVPISTHPEVLHIHSTYLDNIQHLDTGYLNKIKNLKNTNPQKYYYQFIGGWALKPEGVIYPNWKEGVFDNSLPFVYGLDFGVNDPTTCVKVAVDNDRKLIYLCEMFGGSNMNNDMIIESINSLCEKDSLLIGDSEDKRLINELRRKNINIQKSDKHGYASIANRIRTINNYTLIVDQESYKLKKELNNYVFHDKKANLPLENGYDHYINAFEYGAMKLIRRLTNESYTE